MLYSHHRNSVFAEKGSAAPSQDDRVARHRTSSYAPVARHVQVSEENLSGLIKRTPHPVRPNLPELSDSSPQSAKKTSDDDGNVIDINVSGLIRRGDLNRSGDPCAAAPSPGFRRFSNRPETADRADQHDPVWSPGSHRQSHRSQLSGPSGQCDRALSDSLRISERDQILPFHGTSQRSALRIKTSIP